MTYLLKETGNFPYTVNTLYLSEKSDNLKLILDLRHANMHVYEDKTKFEKWDDMLNHVENECFMYKFDIKQGYHHMDIKAEHQKHLDFAWEINEKVRYFVFCPTICFNFSSIYFHLNYESS